MTKYRHQVNNPIEYLKIFIDDHVPLDLALDPISPALSDGEALDIINPQKTLFPSSSPSRLQPSSRTTHTLREENVTPISQKKFEQPPKKSPPLRPMKSHHRESVVDDEMQEIKAHIASLQQELRFYEQLAGHKSSLESQVLILYHNVNSCIRLLYLLIGTHYYTRWNRFA